MSNLASAYTPLETLLLFHQLRKRGVESGAFNGISDDLKSIPLVTNDPTYDAARLSPDALRGLYLQLLKEETKEDLEKHLHLPNGDSPTSRKRKAPSPMLPTINEAAKHSHLIPQLITRLYTRWRQLTTTKIRAYEAKYDQATAELGEIENGGWDDRLRQQQASVSAQTSPKMAVAALLQSEEVSGRNKSDQGRTTPNVTIAQPQPYPHHAQILTSRNAVSPALSYAPNRASASPRPILAPPIANAPSVSPPMHSPSTFQTQPRLQPHPQQTSVYGTPYQTGQTYYQQPYQAAGSPYQQQYLQAQSGYAQQYNGAPYANHAGYHIQQQQSTYGTPPQQYATHNDARLQVHRLSINDVMERLKRPQTPSQRPRTPVWKSESKPVPIPRPASPTRPTHFEPVSPVLAHPTPSPTRTRTRKQKQESIANSEDLARRTRSVSIGSVTADEKPSTRRRVKREPSTPFVADSEEPEVLPGAITRTRRGASFQNKPSTNKRRRQQSFEDDDDLLPPRSSTIQAVRNFPKVASTLMNGIIGHKHGSRFAQPVRPKDVEGYEDFIKRPQNLKEIKAEISTGGKVINAAVEALNPDAASGKSSDNIIELERSLEHMPPKAIVNGTQLEKEIMRMLANAVMFNPGEDGMVADTREMFEKVEELIDQWRGVERDSGAAEDEDEGVRKKRKL